VVLELAAAAFSAALRGPSALGVGCWPEAPLPREKPEPLLLLFLGITECGSEGVAGGQQCEGSTHADCPENASSVKVLRTMGCTIGSVSFARSCAGFAPP